jgi:hypothetical protein
MAYTQRAPSSITVLSTVSAVAAGAALIAILVGSMFWFWSAGFIFVAAGLVAMFLAWRTSPEESKGTYYHASPDEGRPRAGNFPPPKPPEGRQPPAP